MASANSFYDTPPAISNGVISKKYWEGILSCKENFVKHGVDPRKNSYLRQEIAESWIRSLNYGIIPHDDGRQTMLSENEFKKVLEKNKQLIEVAAQLFDSALHLATFAGYTLSLFDKDGTFLVGSHEDMKYNYSASNIWNERTAGTTSHELAIRHKRPFQLIGPEVYLDMWRNTISSAAPVMDGDNNVLGAILLIQNTGANPWELRLNNLQLHSLGWVVFLAKAIETQLKLKKYSITVLKPKQNIQGFTFNDIIGESSAMQEAKALAIRFAAAPGNILLTGESGTGKELFAQSIHNESRPSGNFIAVNCAAIPSNLIESELFGYETGAFTGAEKNGRQGKIEMADGGTLFLDEIGDMPYDLQAVLLRVLQDKKVLRLGGKRLRHVDFRLITATNQDLKQLIQKKAFREDLYYRLSVLTVEIPPLRERKEDIIALAEHFIRKYCRQTRLDPPTLSPSVCEKLLEYHWPGNVRQLENSVIYAVNLAVDGVIELEHLPRDLFVQSGIRETVKPKPLLPKETDLKISKSTSLKDQEIKIILETLSKNNNSIAVTAELLGISKTSIYRKLKKYGIPY